MVKSVCSRVTVSYTEVTSSVNWELWMNNAKENPNGFLEHVCKEKWVKWKWQHLSPQVFFEYYY
jgi:hypothetical protein